MTVNVKIPLSKDPVYVASFNAAIDSANDMTDRQLKAAIKEAQMISNGGRGPLTVGSDEWKAKVGTTDGYKRVELDRIYASLGSKKKTLVGKRRG